MREKERIPEIIKRLEILWTRYPSMRLGQLIENVYPNRPGMEAKFSRSMYNIEDEAFMSTLEKFYVAEPTFGYKGEEVLKEIFKEVKKETKKK